MNGRNPKRCGYFEVGRCKLITLAIFILLFSGFAQVAYSQDQGEIEKVEIQIVKDKQIILPKIDRNFEKVPPKPVEHNAPEIKYSIRALEFSTPDYSPAVRPLKLKPEPISKLYGNYIRVGYGNYASPLLEAYVTTKRDRRKFLGIKVEHQSFGIGPIDGANSSSGNTIAKGFAKTFGKSVNVGGFISFENRSNKFYGTMPGVFKGDASAQAYNIYSVGADISSANSAQFEYALEGSFSFLKDHFSSSESETGLKFGSAFNLNKSSKVNLDADYFLMSRKVDPQAAHPRHLFRVKPSYQFSPFADFSVAVGVNAVFQNDTLGGTKAINVYPHVVARYDITKSIQAYASITGDMDKVSLHTLSQENNWIGSSIFINHTNRTFEFAGGLQGKLARKIAFLTGLSAANLKNLYFFQNDLQKGQQFSVVYDKGNTQRMNLFGELSYTVADKFRSSLRGDYFGYSTDKIAAAWHRPTYRIGFFASYNLYSKILIDTDFILRGGMKALEIENEQAQTFRSVTINQAADLNVKISYLVSDQFSFFIKGNNLLNNQYQVYLYYPVRGFQAIAGLTWSF